MKETTKRILLTNPDMSNTELYLRLNINHPKITPELKYHLTVLLDHVEELIPVGSTRIGRKLRELAKDGKEDFGLIPSEKRQEMIEEAQLGILEELGYV